MINELIEKEIEENWSALMSDGYELDERDLLKFGQTIAKEVAMRFKEEFETADGMVQFADQIINEVSK